MKKLAAVQSISGGGSDDFYRFLEEVARRLKEQYLKEHGTDFKFGTFRFVFHKGRFQGVEECSRNKKYFNPIRDLDQED